jgi:hypothetical protein
MMEGLIAYFCPGLGPEVLLSIKKLGLLVTLAILLVSRPVDVFAEFSFSFP